MTKSHSIRIGITGFGKMGLLHTAILNGFEDSKVVAVSDPSPMITKVLSNLNPNIHAYEDLSEMLEKEPLDAVVIASPVSFHESAALACIEKGIPFFMEKPLVAHLQQGKNICAALEKKPTPHMIGFMCRYIEAFQKGQEVVLSKALGRLHRVSASIYVAQLFNKGVGWRYDRKVSGGGVLLSQGSHVLDLLTWYFGKITRVNAEVTSLYSSEIEDAAHVMLEFQSGLRGVLDCCWSKRFHRTPETRIEVAGDNGTLTVTDDGISLYLDESASGYQKGWTNLTAPELYQGVEVDVGGGQYTRELRDFLNILKTGKPSPITAQQALHVQHVIEAAYLSAERKGTPEVI
ncbi:MAG: Gfo/Idh/MocA family oxidoreductase [Oligoflexia bacterium]|nr:Gfo/Idh/MocA family oxidoreductase [Oligoflexia bacterium]